MAAGLHLGTLSLNTEVKIGCVPHIIIKGENTKFRVMGYSKTLL